MRRFRGICTFDIRIILRNKLESDGTILEGKFTRNYEFSAPSAASAVVLGHTSNGNVDWKTAEGTKLKDL
jgi:hypothetical protein